MIDTGFCWYDNDAFKESVYLWFNAISAPMAIFIDYNIISLQNTTNIIKYTYIHNIIIMITATVNITKIIPKIIPGETFLKMPINIFSE